MLQIKNITKTYKPKKGVPVKALDDVSLSFGETGLVFILGKSGSGKSTLLNVIGGLDKADSGEFVIKGKSSKDFSHSDYDSYRNTFIGFIFQEYNILNEFTVGQNIALAMELQGKKATSEALNKILDQVELHDQAQRKPNELSGGQKQRVAIARALVKEPEIIMADEPTGALDSNTGKQVFDTLKKLSKSKLVIVVSHDREFAEEYGDRVIELADGKIISDITKHEIELKDDVNHIEKVDETTLKVRKGVVLSDAELEMVRDYIRRSGDIMTVDGNTKTEFHPTTTEDVKTKEYKEGDAKFIKSSLPYHNSLKIGASSLKVKPLRLFFTILLSFVSFSLFGLADTFGSYSKYEAATRSIKEADITYASYSINEERVATYADGEVDIYHSETYGTEEDLKEAREFTGLNLHPVYAGIMAESRYLVAIPNLLERGLNIGYYTDSMAGITDLTQADLNSMGYTLTGRLPTADDEIAITKYEYEIYNYAGYNPATVDDKMIEKGQVTMDDNPETGIINRHIILAFNSVIPDPFDESVFKIVGIVDTKMPAKYEQLKTMSNIVTSSNYQSFVNIRDYGPHSVMFVRPGLISEKVNNTLSNITEAQLSGTISLNDAFELTNSIGSFRSINSESSTGYSYVLFDPTQTKLKENEVIIPYQSYCDISLQASWSNDRIAPSSFYSGLDENGAPITTDMNDYFSSPETDTFTYNTSYLSLRPFDPIVRYVLANGCPQSFKDRMAELGYPTDTYTTETEWVKQFYNVLSSFDTPSDENLMEYYKLGAQIALPDMFKFFKEYRVVDIEGTTSLYFYSHDEIDIDIAGIVYGPNSESLNEYVIITSDELFNKVTVGSFTYYHNFLGVMPSDIHDIRTLVNKSYDGITLNKMAYHLENEVITSLDGINSMIEMFAQIFLYVGLGLAVFSGLLLANFIAVSIANKKNEIGILRALGAKSRDVFTIFFNESLIIAIVNFILSLGGTIAVCIILNGVFKAELALPLSILSFGIRQILLMLAISALVAILASFFPVWSIARKQPIDSIRDR